MHNEITARLRQELAYKTEWDKIKVRSKYEKVSTEFGFSDWLQHVEHYFR